MVVSTIDPSMIRFISHSCSQLPTPNLPIRSRSGSWYGGRRLAAPEAMRRLNFCSQGAAHQRCQTVAESRILVASHGRRPTEDVRSTQLDTDTRRMFEFPYSFTGDACGFHTSAERLVTVIGCLDTVDRTPGKVDHGGPASHGTCAHWPAGFGRLRERARTSATWP